MSLQVFYHKEKDMKKFLMGAAAVLLALGGLLTGCTNGDDDDDGTSDVGRPDIVMGLSVLLKGENLSTENAVNLSNGSSLSSTGITVTADVTKDKNVAPESKDVSSAAKFTINGVSYTWDEPLKVGTGDKKLEANRDYTVEVSYKDYADESAQFTLTLTNWSVEGADTIRLIAGTTLAADWATGIKMKNGAEDVTTSATIALYGDDTEIEVGDTITGEKFEIRVTYNNVTVTLGVEVTTSGGGEEYKNTSTEKTDENNLTYYVLETTAAESLQGKDNAIDVKKNAAATDTVYTAGSIDWENPLYGKTIEGFTLIADLYYTAGDHYDGLLYFYNPANNASDVNFIGLFEDGNIRGSSIAKAPNSHFESVGNEAVNGFVANANTWNKVAVTIASDGTITYYMNGTAGINSSGGKGEGATWDRIKAQLTEELPNIGIGVGIDWWKAGFVDAGNLLHDIRIYPTALTAEQVAAISGISN